MELGDKPDFHVLDEASKGLLGYFVYRYFGQFLAIVVGNLNRWDQQGLIQNNFEPTELGTLVEFDLSAFDREMLEYLNGIYFYILSCHKNANWRLMNQFDGKQVLYLRGFEFESAVATSGGVASGQSTWDERIFNSTVLDLLCNYYPVFKAMSPKDVDTEVVGAERYFGGDFEEVLRFAKKGFLSFYVNALRWKEDIGQLFDRMDHFVVYVDSMTQSAQWELEQLDTDDRRKRVTVIFDEKAIAKKDEQLALQKAMQEEFGEKVVWTKQGPTPNETVPQFRERLAQKFLVTTPDAFKTDIVEHRKRIAGDSARLGPGAREMWLDFWFYPGIEAEKLKEVRDFSDRVQAYLDASTGAKGINSLLLFFNNVQLRIYLTLLMGEHHETGLALAAYDAVMQGAREYYALPGKLAEEDKESGLDLLLRNSERAGHIGALMLSYGKSDEFNDRSALATAEFAATFDKTKAAVGKFFERAKARAAAPSKSC